MSRITADSLNTFIGITMNNDDQFLVIWLACERCTLNVSKIYFTCIHIQELIVNHDFHMKTLFSSSFARDLLRACFDILGSIDLQGITYLHDTLQVAHGQLNTRTCLITQYWSLKLSDFGLNDVMSQLATDNEIEMLVPDANGIKK